MSIKSKTMSRGNSLQSSDKGNSWKEKLPSKVQDPSKLFYGINRAGRRNHFKMRCDFFKKTPGGKHARNLFYRSM